MKHFDAKAEVEEYVRELSIPATFFYPGCYMSNFPGALQKVLPIAFPCEPILADTGVRPMTVTP